ncbi:hypothetical protein GCM10028778_22940 [Barrientosiimonas marina]|uniref:DUF3953 domain-containing protein n=1 Tax=Lentibacillus kimchii TaxID=1542911 RepID=A0ABW2UZ08_9BACI
MLKALRVISPIIVVVLAGYALITGNYIVMPYMMLFMGITFLVMGIAQIKEEGKLIGIFSIIVSIFVFYVSVQSFLFS